MLLEMFDYAFQVLNNMTATTATATTIDNTADNDADNGTFIATTPSASNFNASWRTLLNAAKSNFSDLSAQYYSLSPPLLGRATFDVANDDDDVAAADDDNAIIDGINGDVVDSISVGISIESSLSSLSIAAVSAAADVAVTALPPLRHIEASTFAAPTFVAGSKNRATIIIYPTVSPESIVIPIVSCIFGFPILALIVICCLRRRAKLARERDRRRNYDMQDHAVSLVRFSPLHRLNYRSSRAISLRPERSLSQGFTSLELDTVLEERCSDVEQTQTEVLNEESPMEPTSYKMSFSS